MSTIPPTSQGPQAPHLPASRSRSWLWFFVPLGVLAVAGLSLEIWSNLNQQLTLAKLAEAEGRWQTNGPRDYTIEYEVKHDDMPDPAPPNPERYTVRVQGGRVVSATGASGHPVPIQEVEFGTMDSLFRRVQQQLEADRDLDKSRPFVTATFDRRDGHIAHYVHSVRTTRERLEVSVQLRAVTASP